MESSPGHEAPLRMTPSRRAILEEVRRSATHPTADEVYQEVRKGLPRVSLGTVYRNLEALARHGFIRVVDGAGGRRRYDRALDEHCHVQCRSCGRIEDFHLDPSLSIEDLIQEHCEFEIEECRVNFVGVCPDCACSEAGTDASQGRNEA
jgi:Fur family ferric uptake transcriptional regulator